jgi:hypothetical protein
VGRSRTALVEEERWIDAVAVVGQGQLTGARRQRGSARGQAEVFEDAAGEAAVLDEIEDVHRAAAARAHQDVDGERPFQERSPVEAAGARRIVGAAAGFTVYNPIVMLRNRHTGSC